MKQKSAIKQKTKGGKSKNLKTIKKIKFLKKQDQEKLAKNVKSELNEDLVKVVALTENNFSKFVNSYDGKNLTEIGKQFLKLIRKKRIDIPRRKRKFLNLLNNGFGKNAIEASEDDKNDFIDTLKREYFATIDENKMQNITEKSKNKKKKEMRKDLEKQLDPAADSSENVKIEKKKTDPVKNIKTGKKGKKKIANNSAITDTDFKEVKSKKKGKKKALVTKLQPVVEAMDTS